MSVPQFNELRKRLRPSGAELHVVKSTIFRVAVKEVGLADLSGVLAGQIAVVTGNKDVAAAAKAVKGYQSEFEKPKLQFGYLGNQRLSAEELRVIADLPPLPQLQGKLLGLLQAPAQKLVALINTPGSQLARVIKAKADKGE
jgi:large subunit ribosomal protein L10